MGRKGGVDTGMNYSDLRSQIKTGDYGLCHGTQFMSKCIEWVSGPFSHVFKFMWFGDGLWVAEEWEGVGFQIVPASQKLAYYWDMGGIVKLGVAPASVRANPQIGMDFISTYRTNKSLDPYGGAKTFLEIAASKLGQDYDPTKVQAVCSVFCQQYDMQYGLHFDTLFTPSDFLKIAEGLTLIEKG